MPILFAMYCSENGAHELQLVRLVSRRAHKLSPLHLFADAAFIDTYSYAEAASYAETRDAAAPFLGSTHLLGLE